MQVTEIRDALNQLRNEGKSVFATSSFQTQSIPLLHIISQADASIAVYFVNTGFLFPETLRFRDQVAGQLGLNVIEIRSTTPKIQQLNQNGNFFFTDDPDRCCFINKIEPVSHLLPRFDYWISGVRADQTENRNAMKDFQPASDTCMRFHPMLDWSSEMIKEYATKHQLPAHPLDDRGFTSIGCQPCTARSNAGDRDGGRWCGLRKTECGLHTGLALEGGKE